MTVHAQSRWFAARRAIMLGALALAILGILLWRFSRGARHPEVQLRSASSPTYVGEQRCASCHAEEAAAWSHSHHALAMQPANDSTVLGDFKDAQFRKDDVTSSFYKKDNQFYVRTDGPDGRLQDYAIPYTFGVYPLQQYLVPFPNGRLQCLGITWDSRPRDDGGQRWFHLYPGQKMPHTDPLHWTGRNQTWNYMCAACHSTNLRANYDLAKDSYATTWSEINVACEACHGPGSGHVAWADKHKKGSYQPGEGATGLAVNLKPAAGSWSLEPGADTMHWKGEPRSHQVVETCAPCHSRRRPITSKDETGSPYLDAYVPVLLDEGVYYADGQIQEEDYEYGSFLQSKMYREGVICSDCHNPHSAKLASANLNVVCGKCHSLATFDNEQHHHHKTGEGRVRCVDCHMATATYMVVHVRRDHSFRVPRPDFSVAYGTPNACDQCHKDKSAKWAVEAVNRWYGPTRKQGNQFVEAIDAGRRGLADAEKSLAALIADQAQPAIGRATALSLLPAYLTPASLPAVQAALGDSDALVRREAVGALEPLSPEGRVRLAAPLLADPIRAVRIEAASLLAATPPERLTADQKGALESAVSELISSEMATAERPENHMNLSLLYAQMGRATDAENELKIALRLDPEFVPAMVNLADLYRSEQREDEAHQLLEKAIAAAPNAAEPIHALGLLKVRQKQYQEALRLLAKAAALQPSNVRYSYVYAVALHSSGQVDQAIAVLQQAHQRRPADRDVLMGLITFEREKGNVALATTYANELGQLNGTR
jgi:tetratricopeptide (TPR) repeat protein